MSKKPAFAVILSGCGVYDGSEIHEAVLTLLAIDKAGGSYACFAPDIAQHHVINHLSGQEMGETRNVLVESARIARGKVKNLNEFDPAQHDAMIFPGGFGAAKNLCSFAFEGPGCKVDPDVEKAVRAMHAAKKPIGALCIAPALMARILGKVEVTIGNDAGTAEALGSMGAKHCNTTHMLDATISQIALGAENSVKALIGLIG
jgi:enhancing lycopene biosynthesis protein 2